MTWQYVFDSQIDLLGHNRANSRILPNDAERQARTARALLERLTSAPGQILADEVGMGKTFVALAAAASVALSDERPVAVMVPPGVLGKWQRDFDVFRQNCLPAGTKIRCATARNGVEFLKLLDDPPERRAHILFLPHGALSRRLSDEWVKLALIQRCMHGRHGATAARIAIARFAGSLLRKEHITRRSPRIWEELLEKPSKSWLKVLQRHLPDEHHDDPIPTAVQRALDLPALKSPLNKLWNAVDQMPRRETKHIDKHIKRVRDSIKDIISELWNACFLQAEARLPLLVIDEAHHLKNAQTRLSSLFQTEESREDADTVTRGALAGVFERMLFLTATPFQLGHHELCNILERFDGIDWKGPAAPDGGLASYRQQIKKLRCKLDKSQSNAQRLDTCWGRLRNDDLVIDGRAMEDVSGWWEQAYSSNNLTDRGRAARDAFLAARDSLKLVEKDLRTFVFRHLRSRQLLGNAKHLPRRRKLTGRAIAAKDESITDLELPGLEMTPDAALPFMLAARLVALTPRSRPVAAEGLASSYEAFLDTRKSFATNAHTRVDEVLEDDFIAEQIPNNVDINWYLSCINEAIRENGRVRSEHHPKIGPVAERVVELWRRGEKVVVFCHYVKTGRALRSHISHLLQRELVGQACGELGISPQKFAATMEHSAKRFEKRDRSLHRRSSELVKELLVSYSELLPLQERIIDVVLRFMRTPTFLLRYFEKAGTAVTPETLHEAFDRRDGSGLRLVEVIENFFEFLNRRCTSVEREKYLDALMSVQTGSLYAHEDGDSADSKESLLATVRLVNGGTKQQAREHLMLAFNTPFYPEILIASSVLAEGVDLHLNCRHIIHYDLSWNPSDIEQRTGRVDRIGAKAECALAPIQVFYPYLAGTQDEKLYRVVMDRDRWFNVVMGGTFKADYQTAETIAERVPLPESALSELILQLGTDET